MIPLIFARISNRRRSELTMVSIAILLTYSACRADSTVAQPNFEKYATIETYCNDVPVYSLGNITYLYGVSPDLLSGVVFQEGNKNLVTKIKPKKSWEITYNLCGATPGEPAVRTMWNDDQPLLPIHLIDGDPNTIWGSYGSMAPDERPEWIRIDLPVERTISSVALVCPKKPPATYFPHNPGGGKLNAGKVLPEDLTVKVSRDAWHWETVYANKSFSGDESGATVIDFKPFQAKQVLIQANKLRAMKGLWNWGYAFTIGEVEVRDTSGQNLALVSKGAGVAVSSTGHVLSHDRFTHDLLFVPTHCDLGLKWIRLGLDNGMYLWNYVEKEKGKLKVDPKADEAITELHHNGINVIMCLDIKSNWRYQDPPQKTDWRQSRIKDLLNTYHNFPGWVYESEAQMQGFLRFVEYMAMHFKGRVAYWEIGNECPYNFEVIESAVEAIRKVDPDTPLKLCSPDFKLLQFRVDEAQIWDGKLRMWGPNIIGAIPPTGKYKDGIISVNARSDRPAGLILKYKDSKNFLLAEFHPNPRRIFFKEFLDGHWSEELGPKEIGILGSHIHLSATDKGSSITLSLSDGSRGVSLSHKTSKLTGPGYVGLYHEPAGREEYEDFAISNLNGKIVFKESFSRTNGPALGWRGIYSKPVTPATLASQIAAIGWHVWGYDRQQIARIKKESEKAGYKGVHMASELYEASLYPPGTPNLNPGHIEVMDRGSGTNPCNYKSDMQMAKALARDMMFYNGVGMLAGFCVTYESSLPNGQTLFRVTQPVDTVNAIEPNPAYYTLRTISTIVDNFRPAEFPVSFTLERKVEYVTLRRGQELMLGLWIPGQLVDGILELKSDITFKGVHSGKAWGIDLLNGTELELNPTITGGDMILKDILVKDYPIVIRIDTKQ